MHEPPRLPGGAARIRRLWLAWAAPAASRRLRPRTSVRTDVALWTCLPRDRGCPRQLPRSGSTAHRPFGSAGIYQGHWAAFVVLSVATKMLSHPSICGYVVATM